MAEREAPLLVLAADEGNNGSIRLLWRGCQAGKHSIYSGSGHGQRDAGSSAGLPRGRAGRTQPVLQDTRQPAPAGAEVAAGALPACISPRAVPAPGGAGGCLAPCKGGQPVLSSTRSRARFGVTGLFPSHARSPRLWGLSPSLLKPPVQPRQSMSPSCWVPVPQFLVTHPPAPVPDPGSNPPEHRPGVSDHSPKSGCCKEGGAG